MAYTKKKTNKKNSYLPYDLMNKLSDELSNQVLLNEDFSVSSLKLKLMAIWEEKKDGLSNYVYPKPIKEFEEEFEKALKSPKEEIFDKLNEVFDSRRTTSEAALSKTKRDLFGLWKNIAYGEKRDWDIPWIREKKLGEKLAPYVNEGDRYTFKGYMNQLILLYNSHEKSKSNVVLFKGELTELLSHDFVKDDESKLPVEKQKISHAFGKLKGIHSLTSLFVPKGYEMWIGKDGKKWKSEDGKRKTPTPEEIEKKELKKLSNMSFVSQPVWSIDDVKHLFSDEVKQKIDDLTELRKPDHDYIAQKEDMPFDDFIDEVIKKQIKEQGIEVTEQGSRAFYRVVDDNIQIPVRDDFKNPVFRYATFAHELSHSTMHLTKRDFNGTFGTVKYAKEEMIAESSASLLVKDLEQQIKEANDGELPEKWQQFFTDYYENATQYGKSWGRKFDFKDMFESIATEEKKHAGTIDSLIGGTLAAYQTISIGKLDDQDITPEVRQKHKIENIEKRSRKNSSPKPS